MVRFIRGRSGSGKSELLLRYIRELPENSRAVMIVPEQSSFQTEKRMLEALGEYRAKNIQVLSFRRLCGIILEEKGMDDRERTDGGVKAVLMKMAIENAPSEGGALEVFGGSGRTGTKKITDLIEPMLVAVNEYKMCLITPGMLSDAARTEENQLLAAKLRDSARIYSAYNALLENSYSDPDDDLIKLCDILEDYEYFRDMYVFIDSFTGFSAQELRVIGRILSQARDVVISLCADKDSLGNGSSLFLEANETYLRLLSIAKKYTPELRITDTETPGIRFKNEALKALEERLFPVYRSVPGGLPAVSCQGAVSLYEAGDIYDEVTFAARRIFELVHNGGLRYSDIEIIMKDPAAYSAAVRSEFEKYDIPYFISDPESLENRAVVRLVISALEAVRSSFDTEAVLRTAKTGLTPLSEEELFDLENYVYVWNIRGRRWREPFTMSPEADRSRDRDPEETRARIDRIEAVRRKLILPLEAFSEKLSRSDWGDDITRAVYELLEDYGAAEGFRAHIADLSRSADSQTAEREASVWDMLMVILDRLYNVLRDKRVTVQEYLELFRIYIKKTPVSAIPDTINSVTVGKAGSIRSAGPRVVFVMGAVEGVFPAYGSSVGIFTDNERNYLRNDRPPEYRLPLYETIYENSLKEKFNVYSALTAARERLYVSWYTESLSGSAAEPSVIKRELESIFSDLKTERAEDNSGCSVKDMIYTERQGFDVFAGLCGERDRRAGSLEGYYTTSEKYRSRAQAVKNASAKERMRLKDGESPKLLYGNRLRLSSTKLDTFAGCRFSFFCKFGLEALPLRRASMDNGLYGSAMHYILEYTLKNNSIPDFAAMSGERLRDEISRYLEDYVDTLGDSSERSSRFRAVCRRIRKNAFVVLRRMQKQFEVDQFRPIDFELRIGGSDDASIPAYELQLPTGESLYVNGFVDRVDAEDIGSDRYIRIIDYKTGGDVFEFKNLANGMKLQMFIYLSAILKNGAKKCSDGKRMLPAGVLYVPANVRAKAGASYYSSDEVEKDLEKNLKMKGLLTDDIEVLKKMEDPMEGSFIPASLTRSRGLSSASSVVSPEIFDRIFDYVDICLKRMAVEVYSGNIDVFPKSGACDYCDYSSVCRFEKGRKTDKLRSVNKEQAITMITDEVEAGKERESEGKENE